ncbi:MAG: hypothetical protein L0287_09985 [Anaerolineae bacterium]|nr:hypothetical protein [Anaerolineae bacterium]
MLLNSAKTGMPMVGTITGASPACALRTAFGDLPYIFVSNTGQNGFNANNGFPDDSGGLVLPLQETEITYLPVSRA